MISSPGFAWSPLCRGSGRPRTARRACGVRAAEAAAGTRGRRQRSAAQPAASTESPPRRPRRRRQNRDRDRILSRRRRTPRRGRAAVGARRALRHPVLRLFARGARGCGFAPFDAAFDGVPHLVCYAVKANSNLAVLNILARLGSGFDIVSGGELARVIAAGGDPAKIVFSGVGKTRGRNGSRAGGRHPVLQRRIGRRARDARMRSPDARAGSPRFRCG